VATAKRIGQGVRNGRISMPTEKKRLWKEEEDRSCWRWLHG
jgi:hypothetical protein